MITIRNKGIALLVSLCLLSCNNEEPEPYIDPNPLPGSDLVLDDLVDMEVYAESMKVDCRYFAGRVISRILVNETEYMARNY